MSDHHIHQHIVQITASGKTIDDAIFNGIAGLTDPAGHHAGLAFDAFEVLKISGSIAHPPGDHGTPQHIRVTLQALGSHRKHG